MTGPGRNRLVVLAARPNGMPVRSDFELIEAPIPELTAGQALVRNMLMSVDPAMRPRMDDVPSYSPPFALGAPLEGQAVGEVIASRNDALPAGMLVQHRLGWRDFAVIERGTPIDPALGRPEDYLNVYGSKGLTACAGIVEVARVQPGEIVYVSAAAGAVGSIAGQIAKLIGATVIGSTGTPENVAFLTEELHYDRAFLARDGSVLAGLREVAPDGIDVYFDNVGGEALEAALEAIVTHGRIAVCGMISAYNAPLPAPHNLFMLVRKRLRMEGFLVSDFAAQQAAFSALVAPALRDGRIVAPETIVEGLENAPAALIALFDRTPKRGKLLVRLGRAPSAHP